MPCCDTVFSSVNALLLRGCGAHAFFCRNQVIFLLFLTLWNPAEQFCCDSSSLEIIEEHSLQIKLGTSVHRKLNFPDNAYEQSQGA